MMESLYAIGERYNNVMALLADETVSDDDIEAALMAVSADIEAKCNSGINILRFLDDKVAAIEAQEKRLREAKAFLKGRADRIKGVYIEGLKRVDKKEVITDSGIMKIRNNPARVVIDNASVLPSDYFSKTVEYVPDKTAIKLALTAGQTVKGAHLEQGQSLKY
jgi:hypothetical protein